MKKTYYFLSLILLYFPSVQAESIKECIQVYKKGKHIHIAKINLSCSNIQLVATKEADRGMTVSQFARKYRTHVAINGSFFRTGYLPFGLAVSDYKTWGKTRDVQKRVFLACNHQNLCMIEQKNTVSKVSPEWKLAISGWQSFNRHTKKFECSDDDNVGCTHIKFTTKQPRTMLGLSRQHNFLYMVVADGRLSDFRGLTLDELAELASELDMAEAVNLDGGGSSAMVVNGKRISTLSNHPKKERVVANHFGVRYLLKGTASGN